jgi:hypothetical protein
MKSRTDADSVIMSSSAFATDDVFSGPNESVLLI